LYAVGVVFLDLLDREEFFAGGMKRGKKSRRIG